MQCCAPQRLLSLPQTAAGTRSDSARISLHSEVNSEIVLVATEATGRAFRPVGSVLDTITTSISCAKTGVLPGTFGAREVEGQLTREAEPIAQVQRVAGATVFRLAIGSRNRPNLP